MGVGEQKKIRLMTASRPGIQLGVGDSTSIFRYSII